VQMMVAADTGHFPFREHPERFVSDVTNFIHWAAHADTTQSNAGAPAEDR